MCKRGHEDGKDAPEKGCAQRSQWSHLECVRQPRNQPCLCPDQTSPLGINQPMFTRSGKRTHAHPPGPMDALRQALLPGASTVVRGDGPQQRWGLLGLGSVGPPGFEKQESKGSRGLLGWGRGLPLRGNQGLWGRPVGGSQPGPRGRREQYPRWATPTPALLGGAACTGPWPGRLPLTHHCPGPQTGRPQSS